MENQAQEQDLIAQKKIVKMILRYYRTNGNIKHFVKVIEWFEENEMYEDTRYGSLWFQAYLFDTQSILSTLQDTEMKELYLSYIRKYTKVWEKDSKAIHPICEVLKDTFEKVLEFAKEKGLIEEISPIK